ncbi:TRAP transporter small permease [Desulfonatronum parangueonense]
MPSRSTIYLKQAEKHVWGACKVFDAIAGISLIGVMLLIVLNIILRAVFKSPILGTYEYVGFLTSLTVSMALAHCALKNGHIAVGFLVAKLPDRLRAGIDALTNAIASVFFIFCAKHMLDYGQSFVASGEVGLTTKVPFYPFVYGLAASLILLCLVLVLRTVEMTAMAVRR